MRRSAIKDDASATHQRGRMDSASSYGMVSFVWRVVLRCGTKERGGRKNSKTGATKRGE